MLRLFVALVLIASAAAQYAPIYKETAKFELGGEGGWDYISYDARQNRLYIGHNSEILVVDATSGKKIGSVPAVGAHGAAVVHDKNLGFSTNGRAGTVTVFDLATLAPKQEIKVGENPDTVIYDDHSKRVLVFNNRGNDLMVIDPGALKVVNTVPLGGSPEFAVATPGKIFVNIEDTSEIIVVESNAWKVTARWKLGECESPTGLALDDRQMRLFTACGNQKMAVVDAKTGDTLSYANTGAGTDGAAYDSELGYAFASNGADATLTVVVSGPSTKGRYIAYQVPTHRGARTIALDPKTHRVFLPTAELGPPAEGQRRPSIKPGTFAVYVYEPAK